MTVQSLHRDEPYTTYTPMTEEERRSANKARAFRDVNTMREHVPALFTTTPHPSVSERYSFTNTYDIIMSLINRGYHVTSVQGGQKQYNKMLIRLRHNMFKGLPAGSPEVIIIDSHDATSAFMMLLGYIKFICSNGMVVGDVFFNRRYMHVAPDLHAQILLDLEDVDLHAHKLEDRVQLMRNTPTSLSQRWQLAEAAIRARFGDDVSQGRLADLREPLLMKRRDADQHDDLFTVMNIVQENILRGGHYYRAGRNLSMRRMSDVRSIDRNVHINQLLWQTADSMLPLAA